MTEKGVLQLRETGIGPSILVAPGRSEKELVDILAESSPFQGDGGRASGSDLAEDDDPNLLDLSHQPYSRSRSRHSERLPSAFEPTKGKKKKLEKF